MNECAMLYIYRLSSYLGCTMKSSNKKTLLNEKKIKLISSIVFLCVKDVYVLMNLLISNCHWELELHNGCHIWDMMYWPSLITWSHFLCSFHLFDHWGCPFTRKSISLDFKDLRFCSISYSLRLLKCWGIEWTVFYNMIDNCHLVHL